MKWIRALIMVSLWLACQVAQAQWQWLDRDGRKVFSDRPPPPDIATRSILKQPGKAALIAPVAVPAAGASAASPASAQAPDPNTLQLSAQDKELEARKKKAEAEKAAEVKAQADYVANAKATNCAHAKERQALMDSGVRVSIPGSSGERNILDDAGRASEIKAIRALMDANCQ